MCDKGVYVGELWNNVNIHGLFNGINFNILQLYMFIKFTLKH